MSDQPEARHRRSLLAGFKANPRVFTLVYVFCLTLVFVGVTSGVAAVLRPRIKLNERLLTHRVIVQAAGLMPEGAVPPQEIDRIFNDRFRPIDDRDTQGMEIYRVDGGRRGYVFKTAGQGYWGLIEGYAGVTGDRSTLTGVVFYKHVETPGLGGEITTEAFRRQFVGKPLDPGRKPMIAFVPPDAQLEANQVHAITGATRTSDAVQRFLNADLRRFLDIIQEDGD